MFHTQEDFSVQRDHPNDNPNSSKLHQPQSQIERNMEIFREKMNQSRMKRLTKQL